MASEQIVTTACNENKCHECDGYDGVCECLCHMPPVALDKATIDIAEHDAIVLALEEKIVAWKEFADAQWVCRLANRSSLSPTSRGLQIRFDRARKQLEKLGEAPP